MANFTPYKLASGKVVNIPTTEIQRNMALLKISRDEAVDLWLYDNEYIGNDEADALTNKAKENRITATIHQAKAEYKQKTQRERVKKEDPTKEGIIKAVAEMLPSLNAENIEIVNAGKLITFTIGADKYKLDLIRQRPPKEGKG
mgnify:CR=1 FL=1